MKTLTLMIVTALVLGACETTKTAGEVSIDVRPVTQMSEPGRPQKIDIQETDINVQLAKAEKLYARADFVDSYAVYKTLLLNMDAQQAKYQQALLGLADSALALSWRDAKYAGQARKVYDRLSESKLATQPQKHQAEAGILLLGLPDYPQQAAEQRLQQALENSPDDPRLWNALGRLHDQNASWLDALDAYIQALSVAQKKGQSPTAVINNMGMSLLLQGRQQEAIAKFEQAVASKPDMPVYGNNLRLARTLAGQTEHALEGLSDTRVAQIYNDAGVIAQTQGDHIKAASFYKKAIEKSPLYFKLAEQNLAGLTPAPHADGTSDEVRSLPFVQAPVLSDASAYATELSRG